MLSLEQIKRLENRVYKAVELLKAMKEDNNILKSELKSANERVEELEQIISDYRNNQLEIEQGIVKAIQQLDDLDSIDDTTSSDMSDNPESSATITTETVQEIESSEVAELPQRTDSPEIKEEPAEEESAIPVTADVISDSAAESAFTEAESTDRETETEESSQQLDIF